MLRPRKLFQDASVQLPADVTIAREGQVWVGTGVPASREDARSVFRIMQQSKTALGCSFNQRFSIWTGGAIAPVYMLAVKITLRRDRGVGTLGWLMMSFAMLVAYKR